MILYWLIIFVFLLLLYLFGFQDRGSNGGGFQSPPEVPGTLPFVGHVLYMGARPHLKLMEWAKSYGSMFFIGLGNYKTLVVDDPLLMKEIFSDNSFTGRIQNYIMLYPSKSHGLIMSEGNTWETQRRFTLKHLRDFGFKKNFMENLILDEVKEVLVAFKENLDRPFCIEDTFNLSVVSALWVLTAGEKLHHGNKTLLNLHGDFIKAINRLVATGVMFAPALRHVAPSLLGWNRYLKAFNAVEKFIQETITHHEETVDYSNPRDLIDSYLIEISNTQDAASDFYGERGHRNLHATIIDIFSAGAETTSTTLNWALLYLTEYQDVQVKVQKEVINVVGSNRSPSLTDRPKMPYTEATICEVLRMSSMVPLGVMHRALSDKEVNGFFIRKGTVVLGNLYSAHHNPNYWKNPEKFLPERFLSDNGEKLKNPPAFIPFEVGKRRCLGENLAMETLFLFIASIFQNFRLTKYKENEPLDLLGMPGFVRTPKPFFVRIEKKF